MKTMMNLNLRTISIVLGLAILFLMPNLLNAQSKSKYTFGIGVNGGIGLAAHNSDAYTKYESFLDSNSNTSKAMHFNKGIHAWFTYSLGKKADLQVGLGYQQTGFTRKQTDLQYFNYTYPGIGFGQILDKSNTQKEITYNYRFHYLQFPIIINRSLGRSSDFKWVYKFSAGLTPQILVKHNLVANCNPGFTIDSEKQFKLDSTGFDAKRIAISMQVGFNIEYRDSKEKTYFFQPLLGIYPTSVTGSNNKAYPFYFGMNVGMLFSNIKK